MEMIDVTAIRMRYEGCSPHLNERSRRLFAANEAQSVGRGGLAAVFEATGIARSTIRRGLSNLRGEPGPHHPPGTSKWNRVEHRLFAFITQNWRGKPLISHQVIIQMIGATTTRTGLDVQCRLGENKYPKGIKVSDRELAAINLERDDFHGEWNYTISPILPEPVANKTGLSLSDKPRLAKDD